MNIQNTSPLRYPGGKTRACKKLDALLKSHFFSESRLSTQFNQVLSPFFGGGSFEFYLQHHYPYSIVANDKFTPLYQFWTTCKHHKTDLCNQLGTKLGTIDKETFANYRNTILQESDPLIQSTKYFVINRCSFSGATMSGGYSTGAATGRFTRSSVDRIQQLNLDSFSIYNLDFEDFIRTHHTDTSLMFLDPPYYLEKASKLYGNNGDMHEHFDHVKLHRVLSTKKNWLLTYNDCEYIRDLYKDYLIVDINWSYGMNATKQSSEIVILN